MEGPILIYREIHEMFMLYTLSYQTLHWYEIHRLK